MVRWTPRATMAIGLALALAMTAGAATAAEPVPDPVEHRIPVDRAGGLALRELATVLLREAGSGVSPSPALDAGRVDVSRLRSPAVLLAANLALATVGVGLRVDEDALVLRIDRDRLRSRVDALERLLRTVFGRGPPIHTLERVAGSSPSGPPVVMIHGLDSGPARLEGAGAALARAGYDVYLYRYPNDASASAAAAALGDLLRELRQRRGRPIALVTVSMGGIIARAWLELDPRAGDEVSCLIACVPPFGGSEMARYHMLTELAETATDMMDQGFDGFFAFDGLGQGARELVPGSPLLRRLARSAPRPGVRYSILAGDRAVVGPEVFQAARAAIRALRQGASAGRALGIDLFAELVDSAEAVSGGRGDGAVSLASQSMPGVSDRVVLPMSHLEALAGDGSSAPIPALGEVLARLPPARGAE